MAHLRIGVRIGLLLALLAANPLGPSLARAATSSNTSVSARGVIFVHGIHGDARLPGFQALLQPLVDAYPNTFETFAYFDDVANRDSTTGQCAAHTLPTYTAVPGFPVQAPVEGALPFCDSEDDVGLNAVLLDQEITRRASLWSADHITLIANSMGGAIVRAYLAYATETHSPSLAAIDSIVFLQGAQQGSWIAKADDIGNSLIASSIPGVRSAVKSLEQLVREQFSIDAHRPAIVDLTPQSQMYLFDSQPNYLPAIRYANVASDITTNISTQVWWWTITAELPVRLGDYVLVPGFDDPTRTDWMGGARFLPSAIGRGVASTQWVLPGQATIRPTTAADGTPAWDLSEALNAPMSHFQLGSQLASVGVDTPAGQMSLDRALLDWIANVDSPSALARTAAAPQAGWRAGVAPVSRTAPVPTIARPGAEPEPEPRGILAPSPSSRAATPSPSPRSQTRSLVEYGTRLHPVSRPDPGSRARTLSAFETASLAADWHGLYQLLPEEIRGAHAEANFAAEGDRQLGETGRVRSLRRLALEDERVGKNGVTTFRATYEAARQFPNGSVATTRYLATFLQQDASWRLWFMDAAR